MKAAFGLLCAGPPSGAGIFTRAHGPCAMRAADTGVIEVMQRIVWNVVGVDVIPDILRSPIGDWVDLDEPEFAIPFDLFCGCTERGLIAANGSNPGTQRS